MQQHVRKNRLPREGLNRIIVQAIFEELVINFFDNPEFTGFGLSNVQLYQTMKNILLYGILKTEPPDDRPVPVYVMHYGSDLHTATDEAVHVRFMLHHVLRNDAKGGEVGVYLLPGK